MRIRIIIRGIAAVASASCAMALCACVAQPGESASTAPSNLSRMQTVLQQIDDDGGYTPLVALQALSVAFGPIAGVRTPEGSVNGTDSGTLAVDMVRSSWNELEPSEQAAALDLVPELSPSPSAQGASLTPTSTVDPFERIAGDAFAWYLHVSGISDPGWRPHVAYGQHEKATVAAFAIANAASCEIKLVHDRFDRREASIKNYLLAHEAFHCAQGLVTGGDDESAPWLNEGLATWAAVNAPRGADGAIPASYFYSDDSPDFWFSYFLAPHRSLYARSYDAFGFFTYLDQHRVDLWHLWPTLSSDSHDAFVALTGATSTLVDWASGYFRDSSRAGWDMTGPGIPSVKPDDVDDTFRIENGSHEAQPILEAATDYARVVSTADILDVVLDGVGRMKVGTGSEPFVPAHSMSFCSRPDGCNCPDGLTLLKPLAPLSRGEEVVVALTGGVQPGSFGFTGRSFDPTQECARTPAGAWTLKSFAVTGDEFSVEYRPISGATTITVSGADQPSTMEMASDFAGTLTLGSDSTTNVVSGRGHASPQLLFDATSSTLEWIDGPNDVGFAFTINGQQVTDSDVGVQSSFEPINHMTYSLNDSTMTWVYPVEGGKGTWIWRR
ncbi:hypothetical protein VD659_09870 [Herbiconiux sp. 11R-BC]|uniref:hypothetical protein n=1 Tax=Herbiconiux sp. 11R-BC TaxID=3111637 RepID=UPI003C046B3C